LVFYNILDIILKLIEINHEEIYTFDDCDFNAYKYAQKLERVEILKLFDTTEKNKVISTKYYQTMKKRINKEIKFLIEIHKNYGLYDSFEKLKNENSLKNIINQNIEEILIKYKEFNFNSDKLLNSKVKYL
jgi:hypothetical protein